MTFPVNSSKATGVTRADRMTARCGEGSDSRIEATRCMQAASATLEPPNL